MRLHADRVDHGVRPAAVRALAQRVADVVDLLDVDRLDAVALGEREPLGHEVEAEHAPGAAVLGDPGTHLADRAEAEDGDAAALGDRGVLDRLPRGGQDVGEVDEALVGRALGDLDRAVVGLRDAQQLGLAAGDLAVELGVAEQRGALALLAVLGRLALRLQPLVAHPAVPAGDVERDHHAVARGDVLHVRADGLDDAHRLVAEDVALVDERAEHLVEMQVRAADARAGDADDRVGRLLDGGVRHVVDPDVPLAVVGDCLHPSGMPASRQAVSLFTCQLAREGTHREAAHAGGAREHASRPPAPRRPGRSPAWS